jgi:3',5'-cyclic AMP phosphodiesterase CpdA
LGKLHFEECSVIICRRFKLLGLGLVLWLLFLLSATTAFAENHFSFVVFGDNRDGQDTFSDLIQKVNAEPNLSFAISTGDFVSRGSLREYQAYLKLIKKLNLKLYHAMGNHDAVYGGYVNYNKFFGPAFSSFDFRGAHFVLIDNSFDRRLTKSQLHWLKNDLASHKGKKIFVFMHRPCWDPFGVFGGHIMESATKAQYLMDLFEEYGVLMVCAGHIHGFAESTKNGVQYLVTAGAGAPLYVPEFMGGYYHYVVVVVEDDRVTYEVKRVYP